MSERTLPGWPGDEPAGAVPATVGGGRVVMAVAGDEAGQDRLRVIEERSRLTRAQTGGYGHQSERLARAGWVAGHGRGGAEPLRQRFES
jgi:hypothetical protein